MSRSRALALAIVSVVVGSAVGCKRPRHAHVPSYSASAVPAGFVQRPGAGWVIAVPSTWREAVQKGGAVWSAADPQRVDGFRANVNVVLEPFAGESYDYAAANEVALRREPRATVEATRDALVDGDPTLIIESRWVAAPPATVGYRTLQSALASRGFGYVATCSVASTAFERYRATCESILKSFAVER